MDFARQKDEIEAIESIFDVEELSTFTLQSQNYLKFNAFQTASQTLSLSFKKKFTDVPPEEKEDETNLSVTYLPPIELDVELPKNYPSESPPLYSISCMWLSSEDLETVCSHIDSMWSKNTEVLYQWAQFLKEEVLNLLAANFHYVIKFQQESSGDCCNTSNPNQVPCKQSSSPAKPNSELVMNNNRQINPRYIKKDPLVFYNKQFDKQNYNFDGSVKSAGFVENTYRRQNCYLDGNVRGSGCRDNTYRRFHRFQRRPHSSKYDRPNFESESTTSNSNVSSDQNDRILDKQVSNGQRKQGPSKVIKPRIKKCSENYNEKFLRKYLESYNFERELSEFRKTYYTCYICFEDKFGLSCVRFQPCCHVYCRDCIRSYLQTRIAEGSVQMIKCPNTDCDSNVLPVQVREIVGPEHFAKYDNLLLTTMLETMTDIIRCPRLACQYPVTKEPDEKMALCPACSYAFCVQCKMGYHGVEPCRFKHHEKEALLNEYLNGDEDVRQRLEQKYGKSRLGNLIQTSLSEKWIDNNSKNCCNCNASIEKSEGCNKMLCWRCSTYFCWNCLTRLDPKAPYAHYYDRNSPCYNRLFEGTPNDEFDDDEVFVILDGDFIDDENGHEDDFHEED